MTERVVAVLARPAAALPAALGRAMLTDVVELVADTPQVGSALIAVEGYDVDPPVEIWPGTQTVTVPDGATLADLLGAVEAETAVAVVVPDAPDLPSLLLGKLFSALAGPRGAAAAACPAESGGLVAIAANVPVAGWLSEVTADVDDPDALEALRRAAPVGGFSVGPGWHRVRSPADLDRLDPGLEGWESTRSYLG